MVWCLDSCVEMEPAHCFSSCHLWSAFSVCHHSCGPFSSSLVILVWSHGWPSVALFQKCLDIDPCTRCSSGSKLVGTFELFQRNSKQQFSILSFDSLLLSRHHRLVPWGAEVRPNLTPPCFLLLNFSCRVMAWHFAYHHLLGQPWKLSSVSEVWAFICEHRLVAALGPDFIVHLLSYCSLAALPLGAQSYSEFWFLW